MRDYILRSRTINGTRQDITISSVFDTIDKFKNDIDERSTSSIEDIDDREVGSILIDPTTQDCVSEKRINMVSKKWLSSSLKSSLRTRRLARTMVKKFLKHFTREGVRTNRELLVLNTDMVFEQKLWSYRIPSKELRLNNPENYKLDTMLSDEQIILNEKRREFFESQEKHFFVDPCKFPSGTRDFDFYEEPILEVKVIEDETSCVRNDTINGRIVVRDLEGNLYPSLDVLDWDRDYRTHFWKQAGFDVPKYPLVSYEPFANEHLEQLRRSDTLLITKNGINVYIAWRRLQGINDYDTTSVDHDDQTECDYLWKTTRKVFNTKAFYDEVTKTTPNMISRIDMCTMIELHWYQVIASLNELYNEYVTFEMAGAKHYDNDKRIYNIFTCLGVSTTTYFAWKHATEGCRDIMHRQLEPFAYNCLPIQFTEHDFNLWAIKSIVEMTNLFNKTLGKKYSFDLLFDFMPCVYNNVV
jgi:hypothetical protein